MTAEEGLTRLEGAFITISQLAIQTKSQTDALFDLAAESKSQTEILRSQTESLTSQTGILTDLARGADERMDTRETWINTLAGAQSNLTEAQANSEIKITALTDALIRLGESHSNSDTQDGVSGRGDGEAGRCAGAFGPEAGGR